MAQIVLKYYIPISRLRATELGVGQVESEHDTKIKLHAS